MNTQIKGNLSITRNANLGGSFITGGNATVKGCLSVEGWLDAPHVKNPCKGLFATAERLNEAYPNPRPGWWALVGNTLPAEIYQATAQGWGATGNQGGAIEVPLSLYDERISQVSSELQDIAAQIDSLDHPVAVDDNTSSDLDVVDEQGNVLVRFSNGHIRTKKFNSANLDSDGQSIKTLNAGVVESSVMANIGSGDATFLCFTDIHGDSVNFSRIKEWRAQYDQLLSDTLCLGDINDVDCRESLYWYDADQILTVIGNHDVYTSGMTGDIGEGGCQSRYMPNISSWGVSYQPGKCYYYKDYSNLRLIVLDAMHWSDSQLQWLNACLTSARAANKKVLVASHFPVGQYTSLDCTFCTIDTFITEYSTTQIPEAVQSFINAGGAFVAYLCGHTHNDVVATLRQYPDQLMICFDSATRRVQNKDLRTVGTKAQDSFNIVGIDTSRSTISILRIGNTIDRYLRFKQVLTINYQQKSIITNY